jgi:hypothetical protein
MNDEQQTGLIQALSVRQNAIIGLSVGLFVAAIGYIARVFRLLGPLSGTRSYPVIGPEGWFLLLAVVLLSTTALLVTILLTLINVAVLLRRL